MNDDTITRLTPEATGQAYDQIADRWQDNAFDSTRGLDAHRRALGLLKNGQYALDVGCGCNSRVASLLREAGLTVEGVDVSARMIELARQTMPDQTFHHADICTWSLPRAYDFITAWECVMHLPLTEVDGVLSKLMSGLAPGGVFLFTAAAIAGPFEGSNDAMGPEVY